MATIPHVSSNVIPFRRPEPASHHSRRSREAKDMQRQPKKGRRGRSLKADREIVCAVLEEHLGNLEGAAVVLAHSLQRQRTLLSELKAMESWDWDISAAGALFGDAVLFHDYQLQVVNRVTQQPVKG